MRQQVLAAIAGVTLASLAAVGAFASQDAVNLLEDPTETPIATDTPSDPTETATPDGTETAVPTATNTPEDGTPTSEATETATPEATGTPDDATPTPEATGTPGGEEEDDTRGIPDSNPSKHPEDGDGVCEKGETVVKTTPSGNKVTVPCHAGDDLDEEEAAGDDDEDEDEDESSGNRGKGKRK